MVHSRLRQVKPTLPSNTEPFKNIFLTDLQRSFNYNLAISNFYILSAFLSIY